MATVSELRNTIPQEGELVWIGVSSGPRSAITELAEVELREGTGLVGDHHARRGGGKRQVTLIQAEHLPVIAGLAGRDALAPSDMRRNLCVRGINLSALRDRRFAVGDVILEGTGACPPCSRMEETVGPGGYAAARGHGGICARVLKSGKVRVGDRVRFLPPEEES